jgi:hypothetical protein
MKIGRNAPCSCGSGKKYKNCCLAKKSAVPVSQILLGTLFVLIILGGLIGLFTAFRSSDPSSTEGRVWSEEHQHWH